MNQDRPWISADAVVFDARDRLLLIRRKNEPFRGAYAFPGGFVEVGETTEAAARRELREETGIDADKPRLIGVYSDPHRDPRHHTISAAYLFFVDEAMPCAGDDAAAAEFVEDWKNVSLAFDHGRMLQDALELRSRPII
jgi:8-oxo-dGTP diphosphatase